MFESRTLPVVSATVARTEGEWCIQRFGCCYNQDLTINHRGTAQVKHDEPVPADSGQAKLAV